MDRCAKCSGLVDTDDDPGCYFEMPSYENTAMPANPAVRIPPVDVCICERCREEYVDENGVYRPDGVEREG
jgi:hypothetical protein